MKYNIKYLFSLILICVSLFRLSAQSFIDKNAISFTQKIDTDASGDTVLILTPDTKNKQLQEDIKIYKGTPYFKNKWFEVEILGKNGELIKGNMAYDLMNNVLHFSPAEANKTLAVDPEEIVLGGCILRKQGGSFSNAKDYYYETIYHEKSAFLSRPVCRYYPKSHADKTGYDPEDNNFKGYYEKSEHLYLGIGNKLTLIKSNARFYEAFGGYSQEIRTYVSDNKLNIKSKADILKIVKHYDTLL